jgi:hypothetical protein
VSNGCQHEATTGSVRECELTAAVPGDIGPGRRGKVDQKEPVNVCVSPLAVAVIVTLVKRTVFGGPHSG